MTWGTRSGESLRGQMPDVKHAVCTIPPAEGAVAFVEFLATLYGVEAAEIEGDLAFQHLTLVVWGAGNDLYCKEKNQKKAYCNLLKSPG